MSTMKYYKLTSSDGESFEVEKSVAMMSQTINYVIGDNCCCEHGIPLPNVSSKILSMVIEYCQKHEKAIDLKVWDQKLVDLKAWDNEFVSRLDKPTLFDLVMAANYLNIRGLLDLTCQAVADLLKDMPPEEFRAILGIQ